MREHAEELREIDHTVTSNWIWFEPTPEEMSDDSGDASSHLHRSLREEWATRNLNDVVESSCLICFTPGGTRGGLHVEFGLAAAMAMFDQTRLIVCGPRENIFHSLPSVEHYDGWTGLMGKLRNEMLRAQREGYYPV